MKSRVRALSESSRRSISVRLLKAHLYTEVGNLLDLLAAGGCGVREYQKGMRQIHSLTHGYEKVYAPQM